MIIVLLAFPMCQPPIRSLRVKLNQMANNDNVTKQEQRLEENFFSAFRSWARPIEKRLALAD